MPESVSESIVLKTHALGDADRIVVLLTREAGVIRGVAKGAKRLKSRFGSSLEPFSVVQVEYFQKDAVELVSIRSLDLIRSNFAAASSPAFLQKFAFLADLVVTILPPHDPNEAIYRMVSACIDAATERPEALEAIGVYFEAWLLRLSGYMPEWSVCDDCGRVIETETQVSINASFHLVCDSCRRTSGRRTLSSSERALAAASRRLSPTEFANIETEAEEINTLSGIFRDMLSQSMSRPVNAEISLAVQAKNV